MNKAHLAKSPKLLTLVEDVEPGIQRMLMNTNELYSNSEQHHKFEDRLQEFLKVDTSSQIVKYNNGIMSYLTESIIPTKQDSRPPLLLLFGNPAPDSVRKRCFFASVKGKREHRFWPIIDKAGIMSFKNTADDINTFRKKALFELDYESPFRIGLAVFYSMPSPASAPKWNGVAGLRRLFRARAFREITICEKERVERIIKEFIGDGSCGAIIAFQKDAYLGVKSNDTQDRIVSKEGKWCIVENQSFSAERLFKMPPTRYMNAPWYVNFLRIIEKKINISHTRII